MRLLIHDFAGYAFPVQLSRELSARGHTVTHVYLESLQGPKGRLSHADSDSDRLTIRGISLPNGFRKYSAVKRFFSHREYASAVKKIISSDVFDAVLSCDAPIDVQAELLWHCRKNGIRFAHWIQDVYCRAIEFFLRRRLGPLSVVPGFPFRKLEQMVAARSDVTVVISPAFRDLLLKWGIPPSKIVVLQNWGPLDEISVLPRSNEWSEKHGLEGKTVFLYAGTIGLKHRPDLLYRLAQSLNQDCRLVIVSEGVGREYFEKMPQLDTVILLDYQPIEQLSHVLASADVLLATLERDAGEFAVPSKILAYLCAGRPILFGAPQDNLAALVVRNSGGGVVADPDNAGEWLEAARTLAADRQLRQSLGEQGRRYAEENFDITAIAAAFETVLSQTGESNVAAGSSGVNEVQVEI